MEHPYDLTRKSDSVIITEYKTEWKREFQEIGRHLRAVLDQEAVRIDHIGSTSVPNLSAKDIIDVQVTVRDLDATEDFRSRMVGAGFRHRTHVTSDSFCGIDGEKESEWKKIYFREPEGDRCVHIHVREGGRLNQRYALLFRDYLRYNSTVHRGYEIIKKRLSQIFPECIDGYLYIKDPLMDIMYEGALLWAKVSDWEPDNAYL